MCIWNNYNALCVFPLSNILFYFCLFVLCYLLHILAFSPNCNSYLYKRFQCCYFGMFVFYASNLLKSAVQNKCLVAGILLFLVIYLIWSENNKKRQKRKPYSIHQAAFWSHTWTHGESGRARQDPAITRDTHGLSRHSAAGWRNGETQDLGIPRPAELSSGIGDSCGKQRWWDVVHLGYRW